MKKLFDSYTGWIVLTNVLVFFLLLIFGFYNDTYCSTSLCKYLVLQPYAILHGQYLWTIVTSMFVHSGLTHLVVNMISLIFIGGFVEKLIGKKRYLWLYFVGGIIASLFFVLFAGVFGTTDLGARIFGSPMDFAVGASGAIFALGGLLAVLIPKMKVLVFFIIPMPMWVAMLVLSFVMWIFSAGFSLPIGNTAHLGGLVLGALYGVYLRVNYPNKIKMISQFFGR